MSNVSTATVTTRRGITADVRVYDQQPGGPCSGDSGDTAVKP